MNINTLKILDKYKNKIENIEDELFDILIPFCKLKSDYADWSWHIATYEIGEKSIYCSIEIDLSCRGCNDTRTEDCEIPFDYILLSSTDRKQYLLKEKQIILDVYAQKQAKLKQLNLNRKKELVKQLQEEINNENNI